MPAVGGVLRGSVWPARLAGALAPPPMDTGAWMERHTRVIKSGDHGSVGLLELDGRTCWLKFYRYRSVGGRILVRLGRGRGIRAYDMALALSRAGLAVPEPLACLSLPDGVLLLTGAPAGGRDLRTLWLESPEVLPALLLAAAGDTLGRLHGAGYAHGDCKWSNLLWSGGGFYLVDLERVAPVRRGARRQGRDLARFTVNAEELGAQAGDYEAFLAAYCERTVTPRKIVVDRLLPDLHRLRARHLRRYGPRGARLL